MRLAAMVRFGSDLPVDVIEGIIASALEVVVHVARWRDGRRFVSSIHSLLLKQKYEISPLRSK